MVDIESKAELMTLVSGAGNLDVDTSRFRGSLGQEVIFRCLDGDSTTIVEVTTKTAFTVDGSMKIDRIDARAYDAADPAGGGSVLISAHGQGMEWPPLPEHQGVYQTNLLTLGQAALNTFESLI